MTDTPKDTPDDARAITLASGKRINIRDNLPRVMSIALGEELRPPKGHEWMVVGITALPVGTIDYEHLAFPDLDVRAIFTPFRRSIYQAPLLSLLEFHRNLACYDVESGGAIRETARVLRALLDVEPIASRVEIPLTRILLIADALKQATAAWMGHYAAIAGGRFGSLGELPVYLKGETHAVHFEVVDRESGDSAELPAPLTLEVSIVASIPIVF